MNRIARLGLAALLLTGLTACQAPKAPFDVTLVFTNGLMGGLEPCECPSSPMGGVARQATLLKEVRRTSPRVVLLDAGDTLLGTEQSDADGGKTMIEAMNRLGYHAMLLGEQDRLPPGQLSERAAAARFPVMGRPSWLPLFEHAVVAVEGKRFGVVSITRRAHEAPWMALFRARLSALWLRPQVDMVVGVSHLVELADREVARRLPELHVLYSGHPRGTGTTSWVGQTLVVHGYMFGGKALSTLRLAFDPRAGKASRLELKRVGMGPQVPDDPEMRAWLPRPAASAVAARPWPNLPITTMGGQPVFPSTWKGAPGLVLVSCWCTSCQSVAQGLDTLQRAHPEWSMRILSLGTEKATAYQVERLNVSLPVFLDQGGKSFELLGKPDCPHIFRMDANGQVLGELSRLEISAERLPELVQAL